MSTPSYRQKCSQILRQVGRSYHEGHTFIRASALAFSTMLTIVPLTITVFAMVRFLPIYETSVQRMQSFVIMNFLPDFGEQVLTYIRLFEKKSIELPLYSSIIFFLTIVILMKSVENNLNATWQIAHKRKAFTSFLLHWIFLMLGPLLLIASMAISSLLASLSWFHLHAVLSSSIIVRIMPFSLSMISFTLSYLIMPNCQTDVEHALAGGCIAAFLFELAKTLIGVYLRYVPTYSALYGALAAIPVLLIWTQIVWVIFLLGGYFTNALRLRSQTSGAPA